MSNTLNLDPQRLADSGLVQNTPRKHIQDNANEMVFYRLGGIDERLNGHNIELVRLSTEQKVIKDELKIALEDVKHGIARMEITLSNNKAVEEFRDKAKDNNNKTISLSMSMVSVLLTVIGAFATLILWLANQH